jgi:hypothetical protein
VISSLLRVLQRAGICIIGLKWLGVEVGIQAGGHPGYVFQRVDWEDRESVKSWLLIRSTDGSGWVVSDAGGEENVLLDG